MAIQVQAYITRWEPGEETKEAECHSHTVFPNCLGDGSEGDMSSYTTGA